MSKFGFYYCVNFINYCHFREGLYLKGLSSIALNLGWNYVHLVKVKDLEIFIQKFEIKQLFEVLFGLCMYAVRRVQGSFGVPEASY